MSPAIDFAFWRRGRVALRLFNDLHGESATYEKVGDNGGVAEGKPGRTALDGQPRAAGPT